MSNEQREKGVRCPHCGSLHHRYKGDKWVEGGALRFYQCEACQGRFTTTEVVIDKETGVGPR